MRKPPFPSDAPKLDRLQHSLFGEEIQALIGSDRSEDKMIAGVIHSELKSLCQYRHAGLQHPHESAMKNDLREVWKLKLKTSQYSIRLYYYVVDDVVWMLAMDAGKRRTPMTEGTIKKLKKRLDEIKQPLGKK